MKNHKKMMLDMVGDATPVSNLAQKIPQTMRKILIQSLIDKTAAIVSKIRF